MCRGGGDDVQSATTIALDLMRPSNWSAELIWTVFDMVLKTGGRVWVTSCTKRRFNAVDELIMRLEIDTQNQMCYYAFCEVEVAKHYRGVCTQNRR